MERVRKRVISGMIALGLGVPAPVAAGTFLLPPPEKRDPLAKEETYPASEFGQPPQPVKIGPERVGVMPGFAAREAEEIDAPDTDLNLRSRSGSRTPASASAQGPETRPASAMPNLDKPAEAEALPVKRHGVQEVALIAGDLGYFPKTFFVTRDIPVRLFVTGASKNTLCIMMDSFQVRKQVRSQRIEEISFTPNVPGQYRFYCPVNGMEGTMVVKELTTAEE